MSISTYAELQSAISNWLHRSDLSSYTADFISIGEARIAREVKAQIQEQRTASTLSTTSAYINLPTDLLEMRVIWLDESPKVKLEFLSPDAFFERFTQTDTSTGKPVAFTIIGDEIRFGPYPDSAYAIELWYFKKLTALSSSTNTLFTSNPDLYLYASLCAAEPFLKNDKRIMVWESLYQKVRDQVNETERTKRFAPGMAIRSVYS